MRDVFLRCRLSLLLVCLVAGAFACKDVPVQHGLSELDANEIMVLFNRNGIKAQKESEEKNQLVTWNIVVKPSNADQARELLVENQLPRKISLGLDGVCKDEGLIPTPKREKCRELLAYKGELINSLERISGIVDADVVLTIPDKEEFLRDGETASRPTASVVLKSKMNADGTFPLRDEQVQRFVANAVPGLDPRDVAVILTPVSSWEVTTFSQTLGAASKAPPVTVEGTGKQAMEKSGRQTDTVSDMAQTSPRAAYTTIFGIDMRPSSVRHFKRISLIAMVLFLLVSALLVAVLYLQIRNRRQLEAAAAEGPDHRLLAQAGDNRSGTLLEAPAE